MRGQRWRGSKLLPLSPSTSASEDVSANLGSPRPRNSRPRKNVTSITRVTHGLTWTAPKQPQLEAPSMRSPINTGKKNAPKHDDPGPSCKGRQQDHDPNDDQLGGNAEAKHEHEVHAEAAAPLDERRRKVGRAEIHELEDRSRKQPERHDNPRDGNCDRARHGMSFLRERPYSKPLSNSFITAHSFEFSVLSF